MTFEYEDYEKLILKLSWSYSIKSNIPQEEFIAEGNLMFIRCCESFVPRRTKFSTYLYACVNGHFKNLLKNNKKAEKIHYAPLEYCEEILNDLKNQEIETQTPEVVVQKYDAYAKLSCEAKEVIQLILNGPVDVIDSITSPVTKVFQKGKIKTLMKDKFGKRQAMKTEKELKKFVNNF